MFSKYLKAPAGGLKECGHRIHYFFYGFEEVVLLCRLYVCNYFILLSYFFGHS